MKRRNSGHAIFVVGLGLSLIAHVWAASSLLRSRSGDLGSVDVATAAISVNLETTDVIDATENAASKAAAQAAFVAPVEGSKETKDTPDPVKNEEVTPPTKTDAEVRQADERSRMVAQADTERQRVEDEAEFQKKVKEEAEQEETKRRAEEATKARQIAEVEDIEKKKKEKVQQAAIAEQMASTGADDAKASEGHVSASKGSILNYGASLRALIKSKAPQTIRKTSVELAFSVAPSGGLTALNLLRPSNDPDADQRVLGFIRELASHFPPPPRGATAQELSYNIELNFK